MPLPHRCIRRVDTTVRRNRRGQAARPATVAPRSGETGAVRGLGGANDPGAQAHLHLLGAVAQFERAIIRKRQAEGIAKAKERGVYRGRKPTVDAARIRALRASGLGPTAIAREMGISRITVYRALQTEAPEPVAA